ncbi:sensor histidine kinase [Cytophaga hutchinsonii]|uniref:histidine kinase n=1 Tax=Cytophaga hutchinsonii (strain ATCC 33406 / DSM 1761 / CIP 103989 / NBRC 15051 / NCIMB 9469 / D465) TaxID=269798 RepID=A0A6N4SQD2_CYTH3|nr:sensor histidine kinase [Cytophaga hutchinsonii]ABG58495.1 signal transduction histidine kinase [Cytophaga hutchinsonii ATCC 33406]SFX75657.1 signal transduction histidine kinase [Cytophaga hutchinsonii ATCC 33406]
MIKSLVAVFTAIFVWNLTAQAEYTITLNNDQKQYEIQPQFVEQLQDPAASYTIDQVSSPLFAAKFKATGETMLRNTNRQAAYWLKLRIINHTDKSQQWLIESFNFRINEISCFLQTDSGFTEVVEGDMYAFKQRSVGHKNFEFLLPNDRDSIICYLRIKTKQPASFELFIRRFDAFTTYAIGEYFLLGIFYGTIGIVALFSLLMLLSFRKLVFLYYSLFLTGFGIFFMCQDGTGFQYLWSDMPIINAYSISISRLLMLIPYTLYFCEFLDIKKRLPLVWKAMMIWIVLRIVGAFLPKENDLLLSLVMYYDYIPFIVAYLTAIYSYSKGFKPALYFTLGFSILLISFIINSLRVACIVESNIFTAYSLNFGAVLEILFLSLSLGAWLRIIIQEKTVTENINKLLEEKVQERTAILQIQNTIINEKVNELDTLFYRLSHDVKGPLKSIMGLANLGLIDHTDRENYFRMIQSSATKLDKITSNFLQLSNAKQFDTEDLSSINFRKLLAEVIENLRYLNEFEKTSIQVDIEQEGEFYSYKNILYPAISNIIENAVKYRHEQGISSTLYIQIDSSSKKATLTFTDNGIGINPVNSQHIFDMFFRENTKEGVSGTGLGLYIVKTFIEKINGTVTHTANPANETIFVIEIPNALGVN